MWLRTRGEYIQPKTETETKLHKFFYVAQRGRLDHCPLTSVCLTAVSASIHGEQHRVLAPILRSAIMECQTMDADWEPL
jgi:cell division protein FtsL